MNWRQGCSPFLCWRGAPGFMEKGSIGITAFASWWEYLWLDLLWNLVQPSLWPGQNFLTPSPSSICWFLWSVLVKRLLHSGNSAKNKKWHGVCPRSTWFLPFLVTSLQGCPRPSSHPTLFVTPHYLLWDNQWQWQRGLWLWGLSRESPGSQWGNDIGTETWGVSRVHYQGEGGKRVPGRGTSTQGGWKTHVMRKTLEMRQDWIASRSQDRGLYP